METVYANFADVDMAQKALGALLDHGVAAEELTLVANTAQPGAAPDGHMENALQSAREGISTTTANDAAAGMAKGAGVGLGLGVVGVLASLFIPGFGLVTGGGALAMALGAGAATTVGGAVVGSVTGYLVDQGVPADLAVDYEKARLKGGAIISVHVPIQGPERVDIEATLAKYQASGISIYGPGILVDHPIVGVEPSSPVVLAIGA